MSDTPVFVCPECGDSNQSKFVFDATEIEFRGFISTSEYPEYVSEDEWAGNGLCPNLVCIEQWCIKRGMEELIPYKMGVPLIEKIEEESDTVRVEYTSEYECKACGIGEYTFVIESDCYQCNNPKCADVAKTPPGELEQTTGMGDIGYAYREKYLKALGDRPEVVDPPYLFEKAVNPFTLPANKNTQKKELADFATTTKKSNSWIQCLLPYLINMDKLKSTGFRKIALAVYIHKTFEFRHIEPLWMYAHRAKLGGELDWSFKLFEQNPDIFSDMMDKKKSALDISRESIQCVYQLLKSMTSTMFEWPEDRINDNEIIRHALDFKSELERLGHLSEIDELGLISSNYSLNNRINIPIGLIECICIIRAIEQVSGIDRFGTDVKDAIFPNKSQKELWKTIMGQDGQLFVEHILPDILGI